MRSGPTALRREQLYGLLGDLPGREGLVCAKFLEKTRTTRYTVERMLLDLNGLEPVSALYVRPADAAASERLPTILYNHSHGLAYHIGKLELLDGREYLHAPPYAEVFAGLGIAALCIDHWGFGDRAKRRESEIFKEMLWRGRVMWGMMVYDSLRALDYRAGRSDVDASRIGTLGMSMGSTMAWWLAALDERIKVCVDICCLTDFDALIDARGLDGHGIYYYVPSLLKYFSTILKVLSTSCFPTMVMVILDGV